jgi:CheY-like chemotaxis protein
VKLEPLRILVVDDEAPIAAAIVAVLKRRGHHVNRALSAEAALKLEAPDVLISELSLPRISGLDLLAQLHERGDRPHTVFVTARPTVDDCRRALLMGASEYLVKPFRLEELVRAAEAGPGPAGREHAPDKFDRLYASSPRCVDQVTREVTAHALASGVGPSCRARIGSACSEIVDNSRRHGYAHGCGRIRVVLAVDERELILRIHDEGLGFDPMILEAGIVENGCLANPLKNGLARAIALSEDMIIVTAPGKGTEVTLRFSVNRAELGDEGTIDLTELDWFTPDVARRVLHALKKYDTSDLFELSPALAVVVGRLLTGPDRTRALELSSRS